MRRASGPERCAGDRGVAALEAVFVVPIAMVILLFAVQGCIWAHAATVAGSAASQGERMATLLGGSARSGIEAANAVLSVSARGIITDPSVRARLLANGRVDFRVTGYAESLLPGVRLPISVERLGVVQRFRADR